MAAVAQKQAAQESTMASPFEIAPGEGVDEVIGALFSDAVGTAIPEIGDEGVWREIGELERNTPPARDGYEQEWKRGWYADGKPDVNNIKRMQRLGWVPRLPEPKDQAMYSVVSCGGHTVITAKGMILMERQLKDGDKVRAIHRHRIATQSAGANLDERGMFDDRLGRMFGSVKTLSRTGRDAADLIDN